LQRRLTIKDQELVVNLHMLVAKRWICCMVVGESN